MTEPKPRAKKAPTIDDVYAGRAVVKYGLVTAELTEAERKPTAVAAAPEEPKPCARCAELELALATIRKARGA